MTDSGALSRCGAPGPDHTSANANGGFLWEQS
jgi:hypothetical protein